MPHFERKAAYFLEADKNVWGNTFDILQPWPETNWNTSTCHVLNLILAVPQAVLSWLYNPDKVKGKDVRTTLFTAKTSSLNHLPLPTLEVTLSPSGQEQGGFWEGRHIVLPWVSSSIYVSVRSSVFPSFFLLRSSTFTPTYNAYPDVHQQ